MSNKYQRIILIVDDEPSSIRLLAEGLREDYKILTATNGEDALELAGKENHIPDIILLDVKMPGMNGYQLCERLKADSKTSKIPVIFVTVVSETKKEAYGLSIGAVDYITKPFSIDIVKARVENHLELKEHRDDLERLVKERTIEIIETQKEIISILGEIVETRSGATTNHIKRVSEYICLLSQTVGIKDEEAAILKSAVPMHNIGKIAIPDAILNKPGNLTDEEIAIYKNHPRIGYDILKRSNRRILKTAAIIAYQHHERWDGTGFPRGLKRDEIHIYARITAIADVFDDIATKVISKPHWSKNQIIEEFKKEREKQLDPALTDLFLENIDEFFAILQKYPDKY
jgi:putative two-component system response regulator